MVEFVNGIEEDYRAQWVEAGRPVPLAAARSQYDEDILSWEVLWHDSLWDGSSGCSSPIAEFDNWQEAQLWADREARIDSTYRLGRDQIVGPLPKPWDWPVG